MTAKDPLSPPEFADRMRDVIAGTKADPEICHSETDDLMEETLRRLGYGEGVDLLGEITRWYA